MLSSWHGDLKMRNIRALFHHCLVSYLRRSIIWQDSTLIIYVFTVIFPLPSPTIGERGSVVG
jgi:hypothetical protein